MEDDNIVIVVEDQSKDYNPDSLTLELYERVDAIPVEREPDRYQDKSSNGLYSMELNLIEVQAGTYFLSVRCGANPVPMRVVVNRLHGHLYASQAAIAEVGPDSWVYHYITPTDGKKNVQFLVYCYHGDIYHLFARNYYPPGFAVRDKNYYQYEYGSCDEEEHKMVEVHVCNLPDDRTYLGLYGGNLLSEYAVITTFYNEGDLKDQTAPGQEGYFGNCEEYIAGKDGYHSAGAVHAISVLTVLLSVSVLCAAV
ncbi:hypothetical protein CYMTET_30619 [Cymbomonas tetramitiformis]|uniref:Uncharacterized protein n=1 Tax=Cymbomonas tetramitiformis TaxID=36881 RepID=A0AAE0FJZ5_9CHLO|nr:hypothetical protein CYMTET_30619 [Cymbomonas tetramitiformis]